jgi:hypothetical protein
VLILIYESIVLKTLTKDCSFQLRSEDRWRYLLFNGLSWGKYRRNRFNWDGFGREEVG